MILSGELAAGTDHLESELAARLEMSRTPIHEACVILESRGLLTVRPRKGVRILPVSPADMEEIYDILTELETLAARKAAELRPEDDRLAPLDAAIADMDAALAADDRETWAEADHAFHRELMRLGGNHRAMDIFEMMSDQVARARLTTLYMRPAPDKSNADHHEVLDAIRAGDATRAATRHREHRQYAKSMLLDLLKKHRLSLL
ncbi:GntR family transcriptional regulator [Mameliella alba]|nr:GntR family transcriptional regulator [Antarctobacter heliothermus]MBY6143681.1 GntR family transcriptional regulator [Mameliella alba]MBY6162335.1 GntR family transcriptional regulator [Mameliella alba]MBY6170809.1 GntR family transcriptional regulator [Mameliella alba]MBY6175822.1 GntR family transcriptional regulator [Mameliella alba]